MDKSDGKPFLKPERDLTDSSLNAERVKADNSLEIFGRKAERATDSAVDQERERADDKLSLSRASSDSHLANGGASNGRDLTNREKRSNDLLVAERRQADNAVSEERSRVDRAMTLERGVLRTKESQLLATERELTDMSLGIERTSTDEEVIKFSGLLDDEVARHSQTKVLLTSRDEFLAIVSHDLRNPIGAVSTCADMLLGDSTFQEMDPEIRTWIEFIKRNADVSLRLISDLLDVGRINEGKIHLKVQSHSIVGILHEAVESFNHPCSEKSISLKVLPCNVMGDLICDRDRILQVLSNLLGNALKFTPSGGAIALKVETTVDNIIVSVSDTGDGIPDSKQDQIFERSAQLASKDRRGLGLGLYISKMLVTGHDGTIWVESRVGQGSTFYFSLPIDGRVADCEKH